MRHQNMWVAGAAITLAAAVIGGTATAALAQQQPTHTIVGERAIDGVRIVKVSYSDLNIAAAPGARSLHRRVSGAARDACARDRVSTYDDIGFAPCVAGAWKQARPQMELAVRRANDIALKGTSSIPLVAIAVVGR